MRHISLKILFITCLIGFGLISCGGGSSSKKSTTPTGGTDGAGGDGGTGDPITYTCTDTSYEPVHDVASLKAIGKNAESMAKSYCLAKDIDLAGVTSGFPLGWRSNSDITNFTGNFDGENHTISNLTINKPTFSIIGLFAKLGASSINNLNLVDFKVTGAQFVGSLAGRAKGKINISNVQVQRPIINSQGMNSSGTNLVLSYAGGLIGHIEGSGTVTNSSVIEGTVSGRGYQVGGLVGRDRGVKILNSYATCDVNGDDNYVGGLMGGANKVTISNSYATGTVTGTDKVGGLVGQIYEAGEMTNSYATGVVTASSDKGGLIGKLKQCTAAAGDTAATCIVTNSYFNKLGTNSRLNVIGTGASTATITGLVGVVGAGDIVKAGDGSSNLKSAPATKIFVDWSTNDWKFTTGTWPILKWQPVKVVVPDGNTYTCTDTNYVPVHDIASLKAIANNMAGNYCLAKDIDLSQAGGESDFPLGWRSNSDITSFTGNFDGEGRTISNLRVGIITYHNIGLFAKLGTGTGADDTSSIKNLNLVDFNGAGTIYVGALAGQAKGKVTISHVMAQNPTLHAEGATIQGTNDSSVGGLLGKIEGGATVDHSSVIGGAINGNSDNVGGLVGDVNGATISNSHSTSDITGKDVSGGLAGILWKGGTISNSYATGIVKGNDYTGGLVGFGISSQISDSHATGKVEGNEKVGGLVGKNDNKSKISGSYATGDVKGNFNYIGGLVGEFSKKSEISKSYATGKVEGNENIGGFVGAMGAEGYDPADGESKISNSYSTGDAKGNEFVGSFVGRMNISGTILSSYTIGEVISSSTHVGGLTGELYSCIPAKCIITSSYFDKSGTNSALNDIGVNLGTSTTTGLVDVDGADDIVEKSDKFYAKSTGTDANLNADDKEIFKGWDATIWSIVAGAWPTFKP